MAQTSSCAERVRWTLVGWLSKGKGICLLARLRRAPVHAAYWLGRPRGLLYDIAGPMDIKHLGKGGRKGKLGAAITGGYPTGRTNHLYNEKG